MFRLAAELEHKAAALKAEALQHLFVALAGSDCKELWTLLVTFFGKGTGFDPFDFLDSAPMIKPPLDLGETDSDEEASDTASSVTIGSVSTTASTPSAAAASTSDAPQASTSAAPTQAPRPVPKPKHVLPDKVPSVEYAEGCIPTSLNEIHHTGIPSGVACKRSGKTTARGASLYICPHRDCGATPYVGDLYGCSSHLRRVHYGTCLICPYCPNQRYYRASGWKSHMSSKHSSVPWFGAPEATQASLMLAALQEEVSESMPSQEPVKVEVEVPLVCLPHPEEISTIPLHPSQEEEPLEESLPFAPDTAEGDEPPDLTPEQEQELLEEEEEPTPRPPTPSTEAIMDASILAPSDLRQHEYSIHRSGQHGTLMSHYPKSGNLSKELATALVKQDIPASSDDPLEGPPAKKPKPDDSTGDGAPSM